jgi:hypothetical protein
MEGVSAAVAVVVAVDWTVSVTVLVCKTGVGEGLLWPQAGSAAVRSKKAAMVFISFLENSKRDETGFNPTRSSSKKVRED